MSIACTVRVNYDLEINLFVHPSDSIKRIKEEVKRKADVPLQEQQLFLGGEELEDDRIVSECGILNETNMCCYRKNASRIFVRFYAGHSIVISIDPSDSIRRIKKKIENQKEIPLEEQRFFLGAKELKQDESTVSECGILDKTRLSLYRTSKMKIFVQFSAGNKIPLLVDPSDSVKMIKEEIERIESVQLQEYRLFLAAEELETDSTVSECGIFDGVTLEMVTLLTIRIQRKSETFDFMTRLSETIADLNRKICEHKNLSFEGHRLLFKSKHVACDSSTVEMNGIAESSTLVLEEEITLKIAVLNETLDITVWPSDTILDVQRKLELESKLDLTKHRLLSRGRHLSDESSVAELGDHEALPLELERRQQVFVKGFSGGVHPVFVWPSDNVLAVKEVIAQKMTRAASDFLLLHDRRVLNDDVEASGLKISRNCPLIVVGRPRGFVVVVLDVDEDTAFCIQTEISANVRELKGKLSKETGIPIDLQLLFYHDAHLEDNALLADKGIQSCATISLVRRRENGTMIASRLESHDSYEIYSDVSTKEEDAIGRIAARHNIPERDLKIIFKINPIDEGLRLCDQGLGQDSVISVFQDVCDKEINVSVKPAGQVSQVIRLTVASINNVLELKQMIEEKIGVPPCNQALSFGGIHLNNESRVCDYQIRDNSLLILECTVNFHVLCLDSQKAYFCEKHTMTIEGLKTSIAEKFGIPSIKQRLILSGRELRNSECLWEWALPPYRSVTFVVAKRKLMWIFVKCHEEVIPLRASPSDITLDVKKKIYEQTRIPVEQQVLFFNERRLQDDATLTAMEVFENSKLCVQESREIQFVVKLTANKRIPISALEVETVAEIKDKVRQKESVASEQQKFFFQGLELANQRSLSECGIRNGSVITVVYQLTGVCKLMVKSVCGKTATISIKQIDRLDKVKQSISKAIELNENLLKISVDSTPWEEDLSAWQMNIDSNVTIFVTRLDMEKFWLFVVNKGTFTGIVAHPKDTFKKVSEKLYEELDVERGRVIFMLDDNCSKQKKQRS